MMGMPKSPDELLLAAELIETQALLARLSSADLGKLLSAIVPAAEIGEAGPWSVILTRLIRAELNSRERV
jgi:hypothetical protein